MTKLKTLKDIQSTCRSINMENGSIIESAPFVNPEEIRVESIKWIKYLTNLNKGKSYVCEFPNGTKRVILKDERILSIELFKVFFNITDEDLK